MRNKTLIKLYHELNKLWALVNNNVSIFGILLVKMYAPT